MRLEESFVMELFFDATAAAVGLSFAEEEFEEGVRGVAELEEELAAGVNAAVLPSTDDAFEEELEAEEEGADEVDGVGFEGAPKFLNVDRIMSQMPPFFSFFVD